MKRLSAWLTRMILERNGFNVSTVANGEKSIETMDPNPSVNLILMDINQGTGIDGTEGAQAILARHDVPIIFLSSHTEPEVLERTEGITSYGYIVKNSGETVLLASIKMAFKLFESKRAFYALPHRPYTLSAIGYSTATYTRAPARSAT